MLKFNQGKKIEKKDSSIKIIVFLMLNSGIEQKFLYLGFLPSLPNSSKFARLFSNGAT